MVLGGYWSPSTRRTSAMKVESHLSSSSFCMYTKRFFWLKKALDACLERLEFRDLHSPSQVPYPNLTVLDSHAKML